MTTDCNKTDGHSPTTIKLPRHNSRKKRVCFRTDHHIYQYTHCQHSNCRLLPEAMVCKITQRNNIRDLPPPSVSVLVTLITLLCHNSSFLYHYHPCDLIIIFHIYQLFYCINSIDSIFESDYIFKYLQHIPLFSCSIIFWVYNIIYYNLVTEMQVTITIISASRSIYISAFCSLYYHISEIKFSYS